MLAFTGIIEAHVPHIPPAADVVAFVHAKAFAVGKNKFFGNKTVGFRNLAFEYSSGASVDCDGGRFHGMGCWMFCCADSVDIRQSVFCMTAEVSNTAQYIAGLRLFHSEI